jgi:WD40 repeat protein
MDHPNIARVFDAGTTDNGRPYFVMELVKGIPITQYCDEQRLTLHQRLKLFVPVCHAVQHAHQKGVIHRDLKPSNVMISLYDGEPVPKVIDFGVAKATGPKLTDRTLFTEFGSVIGTLEYMSPEQAELNQLDVDTRSDVYSLGVLLYELLTGSTPLEHEQLAKTALLEVLRLIREDEPPAPSARISASAKLPALAAARNLDSQKLRGALRGELDWIVLKALDKNRNRRYATAAGLATDIERYLNDEPVLASSPSASYRFAKFCKRNRRLLATASVLTLTLVVLSIGAILYAFQQQRLAQDRAGLAVEKEQLQRATAADLYRALLGRAEAVRAARKPGFRKEVWSYLREAASLEVPEKDIHDIAQQVLESLADPLGLEALTDVKLAPAGGHLTSQQEEDLRAAIPAHAHRFAFHPNGEMLAIAESSAADGTEQAGFTITLRDQKGEILASCESGIRHYIYELEFAPDGTRLAAACEEGLVAWDVPTLRQVFLARGDTTLSLAFDPDGRRLATLNNNNTVDLWHHDSGRVIASFHVPPAVKNVAFDSDGQHLVGVSPKGDALMAWPIRDTPEHRVLLGHEKGVPSVSFSPDGRFVVSVSKDGVTNVWNAHSGMREMKWSMPECELQSVAFHPEGQILASADWQGRVFVRTFPDGNMIEVLRMPHGKRNWALGFCANGRYLAAVAAGEVAVWELTSAPDGDALELVASTTEISGFSAAMHPARLEMAVLQPSSSSSGRIYRYAPLQGPPQAVADLKAARHVHMQRFDNTGRQLTLVRDDGSIGIWNWEQQQLASTLWLGERSLGIAVSLDDRWLAAQKASGGMAILDFESRKKLLDLPGEPSPYWCTAWSPTGSQLAGGLADGAIVLWDLDEVWNRLGEFGISRAAMAREIP